MLVSPREQERNPSLTIIDAATVGLLPSFDRAVSSSQTFAQIGDWISSCRCLPIRRQSDEKSGFRPTRLVDLLTEYDDETMTVRLAADLDVTSYVCLSCCWGGDHEMILRANNMQETSAWKFSVSSMPVVFREAFAIARGLGFRFLWIDGLCIVQDDPIDKEREILQMPNIYRGADLTICASASASCHESFLFDRPDYSENKLAVALENGEIGHIYIDSFRSWNPPVKEPVSTRAWAFQERLLSRRILEYGWRTVRWMCDCSEGSAENVKFDSASSAMIEGIRRFQILSLKC